jgi:2-polyprenyl-6-methoxyphenol hydroxylase-like FAD-dependent oxidoreductase
LTKLGVAVRILDRTAGPGTTSREPQARLPFGAIASELTPYPFLHIFPQDAHERLLVDRLASLGVQVERNTELASFGEDGDRVVARLRVADGREATVAASYLAGCDGARSVVRTAIGTGYAGGTYRQLFYVADIVGGGPPIDGELHVDLDEADFRLTTSTTASRRTSAGAERSCWATPPTPTARPVVRA